MALNKNIKMIKLLKDVNVTDLKDQYLNACYKAMQYIGDNYYSVVTKVEEKKNDTVIELYERNYIIYFTYVLGLMQGKCSSILKEEDYINGEVYKTIDDVATEEAKIAYHKFLEVKWHKEQQKKDKFSKEEDNINEKFGSLIPDFLVHISHIKENDYSGQKLIIEAKTTSNLQLKPFCWDLLKLNIYIDSLEFKNAAYIIVNSSIETIKAYLAEYVMRIGYLSNTIDKIWFFVQNWDSNNKALLPPMVFQLDKKNIQFFKNSLVNQSDNN